MKATKVKVLPDDNISLEVIKDFTIESISFNKHRKPETGNFSIGYIVGSSGSGKSVLLNEYNKEEKYGLGRTCL